MNTEQLAHNIAEQYDIDEQAALNATRIYLRQIEQVDARTIDPDQIGEDDIEAVHTAIEAGFDGFDTAESNMLDDLTDLSTQISLLKDQLDMRIEERDRIVNRLMDRGTRIPDIMEASGLSRARLYAIHTRED